MIKVCGITEVKYALAAAEAGADFVGLVFALSSRQITYGKAQRIVEAVKKLGNAPEVVGVFVNAPAGEVNRIAGDLSLDRVQLSGDESWKYCLEIEKPLIKAIHVFGDLTGADIMRIISTGSRKLSGRSPVFLLDTHVSGMYGGTAQTFDWRLAREVPAHFPLIVAGGLNPQNVGDLIRGVHPWGVDASSGLETEGVKDIDKIRMFIRAVRREDEGI
jgi:phosphoribosylanthranilate isomerase